MVANQFYKRPTYLFLQVCFKWLTLLRVTPYILWYFPIVEVNLYKDGKIQPIDYTFYVILVSYA